jgi:hypothetical protein
MRDGFEIELFNSRGTCSFTAGEEELELASKYSERAEQVELAGFPRLATTLRNLAETYTLEAEREASGSPFDD